MPSDWAIGLNLDNLVPYTHPSAAWSDRHSNVALCWERPGEMGLQRLQSLLGWGGTPVTLDLLRWSVSEESIVLPLSLDARNFRPDIVVETDAGPELTLTRNRRVAGTQCSGSAVRAAQSRRPAPHAGDRLRLPRQQASPPTGGARSRSARATVFAISVRVTASASTTSRPAAGRPCSSTRSTATTSGGCGTMWQACRKARWR